MIKVGDYVHIESMQRTGRVLQLADYRKVPNGNGDKVTAPHAAVVMFNKKEGGLYPFEMMTVVDPPEQQTLVTESTPRKSEPKPEHVWRWCPCCWTRTDHAPTGAILVCAGCGNRVQNTAPDTSNRYAVPAEDDERLPEMAGSQTVAAG